MLLFQRRSKQLKPSRRSSERPKALCNLTTQPSKSWSQALLKPRSTLSEPSWTTETAPTIRRLRLLATRDSFRHLRELASRPCHNTWGPTISDNLQILLIDRVNQREEMGQHNSQCPAPQSCKTLSSSCRMQMLLTTPQPPRAKASRLPPLPLWTSSSPPPSNKIQNR